MIRTAQQFRDKPGVQRVTGTIRNNTALNGLTDQSKVPEKIENLMPNEFVWKSERGFVKHSFLSENDGILQRAAAHKPAGLELLHFLVKAKRPRRRDHVGVIGRSDFHFQLLMTNQRMRKTDFVLDTETWRGMDGDGLSVLLECEGFRDMQDAALHIERYDSDSLNRFNVLQPASVQDRNFKVIEFDKSVVDSKTVQGRKQMLHCGNPDTAFHQRCGISNAFNRTDIRAKFEIVKIDAAKYDSLPRWRRKNAHRRGFAGMQTDAAEFHWRRDRMFSHAPTG